MKYHMHIIKKVFQFCGNRFRDYYKTNKSYEALKALKRMQAFMPKMTLQFCINKK
jgi:hypothetical protein